MRNKVNTENTTNTYACDAAGRLTNPASSGEIRTFMYDFLEHMTSLTDIDGSVFAYEFDGEGNRLSQSLNDCLSKRFVYDGADVLLELNPSNGVAYAWVNGPGIDQPIERLLFIDGSPRARRVFHSDALGSVAALTDPSGLVTQTYAYSAFGSLRSSTGPDHNRVTYTAREQLGDSQGWMYYRHRIYFPSLGRFDSEDPLQFVDGAQCYVYCANNPVNCRDPNGEWVHILVGGAVGGIAGGLTGAVNGRGFWRGFAIGAVGGAVFAATFNPALAWAGGSGILAGFSAGAIAGATSGLASSLTQEAFDSLEPCHDFELTNIAIGVGAGIASGIFFGPIAGANSEALDAGAPPLTKSFLAEQLLNVDYVIFQGIPSGANKN